jgi:hypothetical protein
MNSNLGTLECVRILATRSYVGGHLKNRSVDEGLRASHSESGKRYKHGIGTDQAHGKFRGKHSNKDFRWDPIDVQTFLHV